jgi:ATP-dependent helicase/nuclease subunit A
MPCAESARSTALSRIDPNPDAARRLEAADVRHSVIVQAPAGSGKTALVVDRFLNLLTVVEKPEEILAITFTRKAAAEMRLRVSSALSGTDERAQTIRRRGERLGWQLDALDSRLRIQTIDGFCAALVRSLPVASRVGDATAVTTDVRPLYADAVRRTFEPGVVDPPLGAELADVFALFDNDYQRLHDALVDMLGRRDQWLELIARVLRGTVRDRNGLPTIDHSIGADIDAAVRRLHRNAFDDVEAELDAALAADLARAASTRAARLHRDWPWAGLPDELAGWRFIAELVLTRDGTPRTRFGSHQGFARDGADAAEKAQFKALVLELDRRGIGARLASIRHLPTTVRSRDELRAIDSVAATLALLVIELGHVFRRAGKFDFAEVTFGAMRALGDTDAPTDLALALDYRIKHLLIDEFQDTSAIHHRLFARLTEEWQPDDGKTLFVVGDPMQSIYRFRDADVGLFQRLRRHGLGLLRPHTIELSSNFRSSSALTDWCNAAFGPAFGTREDPLLGRVAFAGATAMRTARADDGCSITVIVGSDADASEADRVAVTIERIRDEHPNESIAVLARNRAHLTATIDALAARGIAWHGVDIHPLAERPVVSDLTALLRAMASDDDRSAWFALLRAPFVGLCLRDLEVVAQFDKPARVVRDGVEAIELSDDGRARIARIRAVLRNAEMWRAQARTRQWLESTFIHLGGADAYDEPDALDHARRMFDLVERVHPRDVDVDAIERAMTELFADTSPSPGAVELMTIHRAKGLEFDHVLLPSLHRTSRRDDPPPIRWRPEGGRVLIGVDRVGVHDDLYRWLGYEDARRDANELIRLMYVAATRARQSLHLFAVLGGDRDAEPPPRSLLATIWSAVAEQAQFVPATPPASSGVIAERRVLATGYSWRPPTEQASD